MGSDIYGLEYKWGDKLGNKWLWGGGTQVIGVFSIPTHCRDCGYNHGGFNMYVGSPGGDHNGIRDTFMLGFTAPVDYMVRSETYAHHGMLLIYQAAMLTLHCPRCHYGIALDDVTHAWGDIPSSETIIAFSQNPEDIGKVFEDVIGR